MPKPVYTVTYLGEDITAEISPFLSSLTFTDVIEGESDSLSLTLENRDRRWLNEWLPGEADTISVALGYENEALLGPVTFEVDTVRFRSPPDTVEIKGLATPLSKALREKKTRSFENTTLKEIAQAIADDYGFELVGEVPSIRFERVTQKFERSLPWLRKLASDYGCMFKVSDVSKLVFFRLDALESADPVLTLQLDELKDIALARKATGTYRQCEVSYQEPGKGDFIQVTIDLDGAEVPKPKEEEEGLISTEDTLRLSERVESLAIARIRAVEALKKANRGRVELSASQSGNVLLAAGVTIALEGAGRLSGKYLIEKATHRLASGYTTSIDARFIPSEE